MPGRRRGHFGFRISGGGSAVSCIPYSNYLSIADAPYSAVADGSTNNATAIQNCINDAKAAGKNVYVPPIGTFLFSSDITVDTVIIFGWSCVGADSTLQGSGAGTDILFTNGGDAQYLTIILA